MRGHRVGVVLVATLALQSTALAQESRTFTGVTPEILECMRSTAEVLHGAVYEPRYTDRGTSTTSSVFWVIEIDYELIPATGELHHTIVRKSWIIPTASVWDGIGDMIAECAAN